MNLRYSVYFLLLTISVAVWAQPAVLAQNCNIEELMIENPNAYEDWMIEHARKPNAATPSRI